jgi:hypothetical protein
MLANQTAREGAAVRPGDTSEPPAKRARTAEGQDENGADGDFADEDGDFADEEGDFADADADNEDEDEDDWKSTIFYWRGKLRLHPADRKISWKGAWVGSTKGLPSDELFNSSENTFDLSANLPKRLLLVTLSSVASEFKPPAGISAKFTGSYLLDQGERLICHQVSSTIINMLPS